MKRDQREHSESAQRFFTGLAAVTQMIRARDDLSHADVARIAGISPRLVARIEQERANPSVTCLDQLAKGLGLAGFHELVTLADESARRIGASVIRLPGRSHESASPR